jgi:hypothetical protein
MNERDSADGARNCSCARQLGLGSRSGRDCALGVDAEIFAVPTGRQKRDLNGRSSARCRVFDDATRIGDDADEFGRLLESGGCAAADRDGLKRGGGVELAKRRNAVVGEENA